MAQPTYKRVINRLYDANDSPLKRITYRLAQEDQLKHLIPETPEYQKIKDCLRELDVAEAVVGLRKIERQN